ncbi:major Facilitator Superfamily protein [Asticcacaulis biprosthecium C19]|uniref:Major Facilitator Superfamily protein n=1 Tax=Asticcacaulis biprosthecium C19 TaxID=715226 RepID=F4QIA7_9CAUL|nr:MFS transporter [Asticcacaulis biprosthecium]EGF91745.1 major Facilitator Superfamily protein [Asticcacaulis biprosthecium C19]
MTRQTLALTGLGLSVLVTSLATSTASIALPVLAQAFAAPFQSTQWVVLAYLLGMTTVVVAAGWIGDRFGRRRVLLVGMAIFALASAACAAAPSLGLLLVARGVQGLGAGVVMTLSLAFASNIVPRDRVGSAMGMLGTMSAVGTALGPSLGGLLIAAFGWPAIFVMNLPVAVVAAGLVWLGIDEDRPSTEQAKFDVAGTLILAVTLAAYALAMTMGRGHFEATNLAPLALALLGLAAFVMIETRSSAPLVNLNLFRDRRLSTGLATGGLVAAVMMTTLVVGPFYLTQALGLETATAGLALSVGPVVTALTGIPAGRLADRFGAVAMSRAGLMIMAAGAGLLACLPQTTGLVGYVLSLAGLTVGYGLFQAANTTAVMMAASANGKGVISGLVNLSRNFGLVTGASVMGAVFAGVSAGSQAPAAVAGGMHAALAVAAGLVVVALILSLTQLPKEATRAAD